MAQIWSDTFVVSFLFRTPNNTVTHRDRKLLKTLSIRYYRPQKFDGLTSWNMPILAAQLISDNKVVGESYVDGSGWFMPNQIKSSVGMWQKTSVMLSKIREYTVVIGEAEDRWNSNYTVHFKHKAMNIRMLTNNSRKFGDWIGTKYATAAQQ